MTDEHEFQKQFWDYLEINGLSLERLGQYLPAGKSAVSKWVNGHTRYPKSALRKTCAIFFGNPETTRSQAFITLYEDFWQQRKSTEQKIPSDETPVSSPLLQRLPQVPHFIGREAEIEQLINDLQPGQVVTLCGPGGIGKTAIAAEAIWRLTDDSTKPPERFPDGLIFHNFYNQRQAALALEHIVRSFGEEPRPTPALAAQRVLAGKRALLILDGVENTDDLDAILEIRGSCGVLVTSRRRSDAIAERQDIDPLQPDEALLLLRAWGGVRVTDTGSARQICALVGGLPLAVRLAGRYLAQQGINDVEYLAWLQVTPLQALDQGGRRNQSVNVLLARSMERLSPLAQQALGVVGALALAPFPGAWVALALAQESGPEASRALGELVNYGLLLRQDDRQYTVSHALIYTYAAQMVPVPADVVEQLAAHFDQFARQQCELGPPGFTALDVVLPHLLRVLENCMRRSLWSLANQLVWAIAAHDGYFDRHGHWSESVQVLQSGIQAARAMGKHYDEAEHLGLMGNAYSNLGQFESAIAYYRQALAITREAGYRRDEGRWLGNLGNVYGELGQVEQAIEYYQQALIIARESGDRRNEGRWLGNLGVEYRSLGQVEQAIEHYQQALIIARESDYRRNEGILLGNLGNAYRELGQVEQAIEYYQQALIIAQEIGDRFAEGRHLGNLGGTYIDLGQVEQVIAYSQQGLIIAQEIGDRSSEGFRLVTLASAYRKLGQLDVALTHAEQGLQISREIREPLNEADGLWELGNIYHARGDLTLTRTHLVQALQCFEHVKSPKAETVRKELAALEK